MTAAAPPDLKRYRSATTLTMRAASTELPAHVCGQVEGVALVYGVVDTYGTTFKKGCLDRSVRDRVPLGKIKLYVDHGGVAQTGMYSMDKSVGVVRAVWDDVTADGKPCAKFYADILDTKEGLDLHAYLTAAQGVGAEVGVSIGMLQAPRMTRAVIDGVPCDQIDEVALREISVTCESSVPGTRVTTVRAEDVGTTNGATHSLGFTTDASVDYFALLDGIVAHLGHTAVRAHLRPILSDAPTENSDASASTTRDSDSLDSVAGDRPDVLRAGTEPATPNADMAERLAFVRSIFPRLT